LLYRQSIASLLVERQLAEDQRRLTWRMDAASFRHGPTRATIKFPWDASIIDVDQRADRAALIAQTSFSLRGIAKVNIMDKQHRCQWSTKCSRLRNRAARP